MVDIKRGFTDIKDTITGLPSNLHARPLTAALLASGALIANVSLVSADSSFRVNPGTPSEFTCTISGPADLIRQQIPTQVGGCIDNPYGDPNGDTIQDTWSGTNRGLFKTSHINNVTGWTDGYKSYVLNPSNNSLCVRLNTQLCSFESPNTIVVPQITGLVVLTNPQVVGVIPVQVAEAIPANAQVVLAQPGEEIQPLPGQKVIIVQGRMSGVSRCVSQQQQQSSQQQQQTVCA